MSIRIIPDEDQPSAAIEIALEKPLPDYNLLEMEQPTPRDVDLILVSQGFRDLVDDARGVLMELLCRPPAASAGAGHLKHVITHSEPLPLEITQLTGAICPGDDEVYRPGLWIIVRDTHGKPKTALPAATKESLAAVATEFARRLGLA
ncbi:MAG TPA: hypothetical protein VJN93_01595 [Candidatus Acidoferrum sp.]|nr:hypothetical protein [Candidatus Acidoferrum sp.]